MNLATNIMHLIMLIYACKQVIMMKMKMKTMKNSLEYIAT